MKKNFDKSIKYKNKWTFSGSVAKSFDGHTKNQSIFNNLLAKEYLNILSKKIRI